VEGGCWEVISGEWMGRGGVGGGNESLSDEKYSSIGEASGYPLNRRYPLK